VVIGGGIGNLSGGADFPTLAESRPSGNNAWVAQTRSGGNGATTAFTVYAICVKQ
jgi:hypothetical protein